MENGPFIDDLPFRNGDFHSKMLDYQQVPQQDWDECKPTSQPACMPLSHCRNPPANWRQAQE